MKDKRFYFTHHLTNTSPVIIDELHVHATAFIDNGNVVRTNLGDIQYKSVSIFNLLRIIAPNVITECENAALTCAKNHNWNEEKPKWVIKKEALDEASDKAIGAYIDELEQTGNKTEAEKKYKDSFK